MVIFVTDDQSDKPKTYPKMSEVSDGYHTFAELYRYRMLYNAAFFNEFYKSKGWPWQVHKSWKHSDGELCFGGGWFIVVAYLGKDKTQQISNHYEAKDWDLFKCDIRDTADEWDGHTPKEAADRIEKYIKGDY